MWWHKQEETVMSYDQMISSLANSTVYAKRALKFVSDEKRLVVEMSIGGTLEAFVAELDATLKDMKEIGSSIHNIDSKLDAKTRNEWTKKIRRINKGVIQVIRFCELQ